MDKLKPISAVVAGIALYLGASQGLFASSQPTLDPIEAFSIGTVAEVNAAKADFCSAYTHNEMDRYDCLLED